MRVIYALCSLGAFGFLPSDECQELKVYFERDFPTQSTHSKDLAGLLQWWDASPYKHPEFYTEVNEIRHAAALVKPGSAALDLGSMCGYSVLRLLNDLPDGPSMVMVDNKHDDELVKIVLNDLTGAKKGREVKAFIAESYELLQTDKQNPLFSSEKNVAFRATGPFGFVFMDQEIKHYIQDLKALDELDLLIEGAIVLLSGDPESNNYVDNVLSFVHGHGKFEHLHPELNGKSHIWRYSKTTRRLDTPTNAPTFSPTPPPTPQPSATTASPTAFPTAFPTAQPTEEKKDL